MVGSRVGRRFILQWVDGSLLSLYVVLEIYAYEIFSFVGTFTKRHVREKMNVDHYDLNGRVIGVVEKNVASLSPHACAAETPA